MRSDPDAGSMLPPNNGCNLPSSASLIGALPYSAFLTDSQGRIRSANAKAARHVNLDIDQLAGRSLFDVLAPHTASDCRIKYARLKDEAHHAIGVPLAWEGYDQGRAFQYTLIAIPDATDDDSRTHGA